MIFMILGSLVMGILSFCVYLYYLKKGQFEDSEDVKYQLFRDEK